MVYKRYNRRRFLQNTALFSTSTFATLLAQESYLRTNAQDTKDESIDALIIGSGFGGAVAALRLGAAGIKTIVLERGRRWSITPEQNTFATYRNPDGRGAWLSQTTFTGASVDLYTGVLETSVEDGITVLRGSGVGGGSLVYNAITYQPTRKLFHKVFSNSIDYEELNEVYYPRVRSILKPAPIPQDILATPYYDKTRQFIKKATAAGLPNRLYDVAVDWNIIREEIAGTKLPSAILGDCWFGINSGAKNSLDRNYLALAEATGSVEILPLHLAMEITEVPQYGYQVKCHQINETGLVVAQKSFTCRYLFLAAGSLGTSKLLVKAKAEGALPRLNHHVGKHWGTNGDTVGTLSDIPPVSGNGGPAAAVVEHFDNPIQPVVLEDFPNPLAPGTVSLLGLTIPEPRGRFKYDASSRSVKLTWSDAPQIESATKLTYEILTGTSTSNMQLGTSATAHPLGGAVLGKACDFEGRVFGYRRLYVIDSALIPGSTGCANPSLTIAALAERNIQRILAEDILG